MPHNNLQSLYLVHTIHLVVHIINTLLALRQSKTYSTKYSLAIDLYGHFDVKTRPVLLLN